MILHILAIRIRCILQVSIFLYIALASSVYQWFTTTFTGSVQYYSTVTDTSVDSVQGYSYYPYTSRTRTQDIVQSTTYEKIDELVSNNTYSKSISLPCSVTGLSLISYTLVPYGTEDMPKWVALDVERSLLNITTPVVLEPTIARLMIKADYAGYLYYTTVEIVVYP